MKNITVRKFIFNFRKRSLISLLAFVFFIPYLPAQTAGQLAGTQESFAAIAEKAMPAVVTVYSMTQRGSQLVQKGVGSGFFISGDGFIVTNYHVIENASSIVVKLSKGETVPAKIIGVSTRTDLAVLKISSRKKVPFLRFADSEKVKIGHYAIAIGSPFSLSQTMTTGIVSYKGRELGLHYREDYIQTDAAINPGNSGGPLLNISGKVIGVNDCILSPSSGKGNVGIGFAIDGNLAKTVVLSILKSRLPDKPLLGIKMLEYNQYSLPVIAQVYPNTPAAAAGLAAGDCILKIGTRKVPTVWDVTTTVMALYVPGDEAVFTIRRNKKILRTKIKFGSQK